MTADPHEFAAAKLRAKGHRYTRNRRALVTTLLQSHHPSTIPELLAIDSSLAQSSVYRNLAILEESHVVERVVTSDEFARFELAEELTEHHHHLVCTDCGVVLDFTIPAALEADLETAFGRVEADTGFQADQHRLDLVGHCSGCR